MRFPDVWKIFYAYKNPKRFPVEVFKIQSHLESLKYLMYNILSECLLGLFANVTTQIDTKQYKTFINIIISWIIRMYESSGKPEQI